MTHVYTCTRFANLCFVHSFIHNSASTHTQRTQLKPSSSSSLSFALPRMAYQQYAPLSDEATNAPNKQILRLEHLELGEDDEETHLSRMTWLIYDPINRSHLKLFHDTPIQPSWITLTMKTILVGMWYTTCGLWIDVTMIEIDFNVCTSLMPSPKTWRLYIRSVLQQPCIVPSCNIDGYDVAIGVLG